MKDHYGREIDYLRISVTDRCDLRCIYCMPEEGIEKQGHMSILSFEEIEEIVRAAVSLGVGKLRVTGGEPLVRKGVEKLCAALAAIDGVKELAMTTNAVRLSAMAAKLKEAGVSRLNVSLDTLKPDRYRRITRCGSLDHALQGIRAAWEQGLPVKLNCVLLGGVNDDEIESFVELTRKRPIQVRFIELMPMGEDKAGGGAFLPCSTVLERVPALRPFRPLAPEKKGVARLYALPGAAGQVGLISPLSDCFCQSCDRLRLTPDGKLKPCLHSSEEISLRGLHGEALAAAIREAVQSKPLRHPGLSQEVRSPAGRDMNQIGG
ncbi:MAG: GTP 3',8-cyclase MoaA [Bacillota bacterium]|nr:GTP 3',8-cyclase MoaA [Bacillota bacterium]